MPSERTVTVGVGHGKKAEQDIDASLAGTAPANEPKHEQVSFGDLNLSYFGDAARRSSRRSPRRSGSRLRRVLGGLSESEATYEARRCLSCGNCCECDGCLAACPEDAVIKLGPGHRYEFDYDKCTGCGACYEQCPVHSIEMIPEGE